MIAEMVLAAMLALVGGAVLRLVAPGLDARVTVCVSGLVGMTVLAITSGAVLATGRFASRLMVLLPTSALVLACAVLDVRRGARMTARLLPLISAMAAGAVAGLVALAVSPVLTFDSWRFLEHGASAFGDGVPLATLYGLFSSYPLLLVALEGTAVAWGMPYTASALAGIGLLGVVGAVAVLPGIGGGRQNLVLALAALVAALLFGSSYVLRMQLALVNSHMLVAGLYAVAVASAVPRAPGPAATSSDRWWLFAIACSGLALARVEGLLLVALLMVAALSRARVKPSVLTMAWVVAVVVPSLWYLRLAAVGVSGDILTPGRILVLVAAATGPAALAAWPRGARLLPWLPALSTAGLVAVVVGLALLDPDAMRASAVAHVTNLLYKGGWGLTWWVGLPLLAVALAWLARTHDEVEAWAVVTVGFVLLVLALGGVRHNPYRLGWGDSANRMMVHLLPAIGLLAVAAFGRPPDRAS